MVPQPSIRESYRRKVEECTRGIADRQRRDKWLGRLRVATFVPAMGFIYVGMFHAANGAPWLIAGVTLLLAFIAAVRSHEKNSYCSGELRHRLQLNETQLARLDRRWDLMPECRVDIPSEHVPVTKDLDVFGHASLYQLVSQAYTPFGRQTLRDWLITPATIAEIAERQRAISFLAPATDTREQIALRGRMLSASEHSTFAFVAWAESPPLLAKRPWLLWTSRLSALLFVLVVLAAIIGIANPGAAFLVIAAVTFLHLILLAIYGGRVHDVLDRVVSRSHDAREYSPLFEVIAELPPDVPLFSKLHDHMGATTQEPLRQLAALTRLVNFASLRRDGLFGILYFLSQLFLLIDFHVVAQMERWKKMNGSAVRRWLEAVGRLEAIASLATLAHDNPHWGMPTVEQPGDTTISASQLGHPLLSDEQRVPNDLEIGPAGTFILVTGSNMSGKSTLLRAVGLNLILAQAGAPVCADRLRMPPIELATSMRTHDSLADGVSFFMAELRRLKQIVDQSRECEKHSKLLVYLLDEVLQGTNSVERHIAVSRVIDHLVAHGSMGMVSTHDLELARSPNLAGVCRAVHFRESFLGSDGNERMTFDYVLRPGVAETTNALKLLKLVGIDD